MKTRTRFCMPVIGLFLVACGGGGGGGSSSPPPQSQAVIDSGNAEAVAGRSMNGAFQSSGYGGITGAGGFIAADNGGLSKPAGAGGAISQVPVGPETTPCTVSGSTTISGNIANPLTITPGDFIDIDWDNCDDGVGVIIDGLMGTTFTNFEGNLQTGQTLLGMSLRVDNFRATAGNEFSSADGDISVTLDTRTPMLSVADTSGASFTVASNVSTDTLSSFSSTATEDMSMLPSLVTTTASGTIESTQFDGNVTYSTPVPFEALGDAYPYTGELLVTGANDATLRLIAMDEINVRILADYDGDGATDETIDTTWAELVPRMDIPAF